MRCGERTRPVRRTGFVSLDRLLAALHANKAELPMVLDPRVIPLHKNGSENDVRCQVTKRKVNGGTRSDSGRDCRDAFLGLAKMCAKLGSRSRIIPAAASQYPISRSSRAWQPSSVAAAGMP
jgi:hypothetical protein